MINQLSRRSTLLGLTSVVSLGGASLALAAAPGEQRFVVVILRGALDGMSAVVPYGDANLASLRPALVPPRPGQANGLLDLGGGFGLHPAMTASHAMYKANQFLIVHAVAGNYRVRSHFEAQDFLESGADHRMTSGWLNRAAGLLRGGGRQISAPDGGTFQVVDEAGGGGRAANAKVANAIAVGPSVPLLLRGAAPIANWAPHGQAEAPSPLYQTILALNAEDRTLGPAIASGLRDRGFGDQATGWGEHREQPTPAGPPKGQLGGQPGGQPGGPIEQGAPALRQGRFGFPALARAAGEMLRVPNGPRLAAMELGGWDTHTAQMNRLTAPLTQLDAGLEALRTELGDVWRQTVVLVMTEFGRTARMNGTNGTDHGTGTVAFVAGGAVAGGRVVANWPGLAPQQLLDNRDLAPTTDLRSVAMGLLVAHCGLPAAAMETVFPGGGRLAPMGHLTAA